VGLYTDFIIFSIASITQLMSIFGLYSGINLAVWQVGVGLGGMITSAIASLLRWWAYDSAWAFSNDSSKDFAERMDAASAA
jgi:hypothetical protein